jgi:hypothetical protein
MKRLYGKNKIVLEEEAKIDELCQIQGHKKHTACAVHDCLLF